MSDARRPRRRRRGRGPGEAPAAVPEAQSIPPEGAPATEEAPPAEPRRARRGSQPGLESPASDLVPRPSKVRYLLLFFAGIFVGRVASQTFAPELLSLVDLVTYAALAFGIAWAWRNWARNAMIRRHLEAQRRAAGGSRHRQPPDEPEAERE